MGPHQVQLLLMRQLELSLCRFGKYYKLNFSIWTVSDDPFDLSSFYCFLPPYKVKGSSGIFFSGHILTQRRSLAMSDHEWILKKMQNVGWWNEIATANRCFYSIFTSLRGYSWKMSRPRLQLAMKVLSHFDSLQVLSHFHHPYLDILHDFIFFIHVYSPRNCISKDHCTLRPLNMLLW